jgi:hypothetical protein
LPERIRITLDNWIRILWFASILANSSGANKRTLGRNVIGGSLITIKRLRKRPYATLAVKLHVALDRHKRTPKVREICA